ncbi:MAG: hypothetical protein U1E49_04375 [Hyphomicrobiaceae bacterium]
MTLLALDAPTLAARPADPLDPARHVVAFMAALAVPALIAYGFDDRLLHGVSVWSKPLKFQAALGLHFATLLILAPLLSAEARRSRTLRWSMLAAATMAVLEIAYMTLQAARGRASHFNVETMPEQLAYSLMGVGATVIVVGSFLFGWLVWRSRPAMADGRDGLRLGAALGLMAGSVLTLAIGGYLGSQTSHWIGGDLTDATGLPISGWSTTGGDLRPAHFLATHMMQVLPVLGLVADRLRLPAIGLWIATALYTALTFAVAAQAVMGLALFG